MLFKIAWRNVWRNRLRSLVVITSVAIGVAALLLMLAYFQGFVGIYTNSMINKSLSHLQVHHSAFLRDKEVKYFLPEADELSTSWKQRFTHTEAGQKTTAIKAISARSLSRGMIASTKASRGALIYGIKPEDEAAVIRWQDMMVAGEWFGESPKKHPIIISRQMAKRLQVKPGKKIVLTLMNAGGEVVSGAFRIIGLYESNSSNKDEVHVMVLRNDLNQLLGLPADAAHEIAILLQKNEALEHIAQTLRSEYPNWSVQTYKQLAPEIQLFDSQMLLSMSILIAIVMLALVFGIINTMLMAVLERIRELGMLMAIGMNRRKVFGMIVLETLFLSLAGAPAGMIITLLAMQYLGTKGLDLSAFSEGMRDWGLETTVIFSLSPDWYWKVGIAMLITALLGALYPAWKAIRLKPAEAIHKL